MAACEWCWEEANRRTLLLGGSVTQRYEEVFREQDKKVPGHARLLVGDAGGRRMKHIHQWGNRWVRDEKGRRFRYCINGWCPMGQYRNGRVYVCRATRNA